MSARRGPPRLARALVSSAVPRGSARDGLIGDLNELYAERRAAQGRVRADAWYWAEAVHAALRYTVRRAAGTRHGGPERTRADRGLAADVGASVRALAHQRAFVAMTSVTLALGIGANIAVFSVLNVVVLRPLPYDEPDRLVRLYTARMDRPDAWSVWSGVDLVALRESARVFDAIAFIDNYRETGRDLTGDGPPQRLRALPVNEGYFATYGASPLLGRTFTRDEERANVDAVVLSHHAWTTFLAADPGIIGRIIQLDGRSHTVIGVMRPAFVDLVVGNVDVWLPLNTQPGGNNVRANHYLTAVARLAPGVTLEQASARLDALGLQWKDELGGKYEQMIMRAVPLATDLAGGARRTLLILLAAAGLVLLIACVNVASLFLARSVAQSGELALRSALGAGRGRLVRQQLIEGMLVALAGAALGAGVALIGVRLLSALNPLSQEGIPFDLSLLAFAIGVTALTGIAFAVYPALHAASVDPNASLRDGTRGNTGGRRGMRVRNTIVAAQVALALVLLVGAGILMRSFSALSHVELGFDADDVVTFEVNLPTQRYAEPERRALFHQAFIERLQSLPGVRAAGAISWLPANGAYHTWNYDPAPDFDERGRAFAQMRVIEGGALDALGIEVLRGRAFGPQDRAGSPGVALISEHLAREVYGERDPIGERFETAGDTFTVIGITNDVAWDTRGATQGMMHTSHAQYARDRNWSLTYVVRTSAPLESAIADARRALATLDPALVLHRSRTLDQVLGGHRAQDRFTFLLMASFACIALVLAAVGVYGVLAWSVQARTREMAIRMALGARTAAVRGLVVRQALAVTGAGLMLGLAGAFALSRYLRAIVYGVSVTDPLVYVAVSALIAAVTIAAGYLPARRATRATPQSIMR